jgi:hypothetical protein
MRPRWTQKTPQIGHFDVDFNAIPIFDGLQLPLRQKENAILYTLEQTGTSSRSQNGSRGQSGEAVNSGLSYRYRPLALR